MAADLELQNKALQNKIRRLEYRLHIYKGINEDLLKQNVWLSQALKRATAGSKEQKNEQAIFNR